MTEVRPPTLGEFVRTLRTRPTAAHPGGLTRQQLAQTLHASMGYIASIESGRSRSPSVSVLEQLVEVLDLTVDQRHHLFDLARQTPTEREAVRPHCLDDYRARIGPAQRLAMDNLAPHLVAYLDERWNIVECNAEYDRAFPGLKQAGNVLTWFFASECSRQVMVDWELEARLTVGWFRALMGRYYDDEWAGDLLASLEDYPDFCRFWDQTGVGFGRPTPFMRIRGTGTGTVSIVHVDVYSHRVDDYAMQVYLGVRIPTESYEQLSGRTPQ
jgi:transcriptional regulator with XRE-family HTH domain